MNIQTFNKVFKFSLLAAGKQDVRYYLNGVLLDVRETDETYIISTDGHRLNYVKLINTLDLPYGQYVLPREFLEMVLKSLSPKLKDDYTVDFDADEHGNFTISANGGSWTTKVIDCKYPDYQRVIPDHNNLEPHACEVSMNANYVADAMKSCALLGAKVPVITLTVKDANSPMRFDVVCNPLLDIEQAFVIVMPCKA